MFAAHTIYVRIYENRVHIRNIDDNRDIELSAEEPFSTERLLIGSFNAARALLTRGLKIVTGRKIFAMNILMHPMEKIEGGLSQVEDRVLRDLAISLGAQKAAVWTGDELSDNDVTREIEVLP